MSDQPAGHSPFEELAAGYVLNALEPDDQELFLRHARQCPACAQMLAGFRDVTEALADTAPPAEASPRLGDRIMAAALADLDSGDRPAGPPAAPAAAPGKPPGNGRGNVLSLHRLRRPAWQRQQLAAAAAALLLAGGGTWAGLAAASGGGPQQPLAACAQPRACAVVVLTAAATHQEAAKIIIEDGVVWLEPAKMSANAADETYVLWQITGARSPLPVGSFDIRSGAVSPIKIGDLAAPYSGTWAFAVSLEHGRTIPAAPSRAVALGQVS